MKALILDHDGTINNNRDFFERNMYNPDDESPVLNRGCISIVEHIINETDAKIVFSTNWRRSKTVDDLYQLLVDNGFTLPRSVVFDDVPTYRFTSNRGHEIRGFLEDYPEFTTYCILDDIDEGLSLTFEPQDMDAWGDTDTSKIWIKTNPEVGLTVREGFRAIDILGRTPEREAIYQERQTQRKKDLDILIGCMV